MAELENTSEKRVHFGANSTRSPALAATFAQLERLSSGSLAVCLLGETGCGKDHLARAIHQASPRHGGPFVVVDCGSIASSLIESELFGHVEGAFTGAVQDRRGAFQSAHGGTLFLDEVGELAPELQPKLLRALETSAVTPVGGNVEQQVDVRIVSATNRSLQQEIKDGRFREDLWFRLAAAVVQILPLRERLEDLEDLSVQFLAEHIHQDPSCAPDMRIGPDALSVLRAHRWPGNLRELRNAISNAAAVCERNVLGRSDFSFLESRGRASTLEGLPLAGRSLDALEMEAIRQTLRECDGNKSQAARELGIAPSTLYAKIKKYQL